MTSRNKILILTLALIVVGGCAYVVTVRAPNRGVQKPTVVVPQPPVESPVVESVTKTATPFFVDHFVSSSTEVALSDLSSISRMDERLRSIVAYHDEVFAKDDDGRVLEFTRDGKLVAMSDPKLMNHCGNGDFAIIGDRLYVACWGRGLYVVNLATRMLEKVYASDDGLNALNMRLTVDGDQLWIGTFNGVYRLDTVSGKLFAYRAKELGSGCGTDETQIVANQGDVWVITTANSGCSGGAAHYSPKTDSWKFFGLTEFRSHQDRIDFNHFFFSKKGLFAEFNDGSPERFVLNQYDATLDAWEPVGDWTSPEKSTIQAEYIPKDQPYGIARDLGYTFTRTTIAGKAGQWDNVTFDDGTHALVPENVYFAIAPSVNGYWMASTRGLEMFDPATDRFPGNVVVGESDISTADSAVLLTTEDKREAFAVFFQMSDYDGKIYYYRVVAYGQPDFGKTLEKRFAGDPFLSEEISGSDFRNATLRKQQDGTFIIEGTNGAAFIIDPVARTIAVKVIK